MIDKQPREITLLYNSDKASDLKAKTFMQTLPSYHIKSVDLKNNPFSESDIVSLATKLKVNIEDLLDPAYDDHIRVHKEGLTLMNRSELIAVMTLDSKIISTPIVMAGNAAYKYGDANDLKKFSMPVQNTVLKDGSM